MSEKTAIFSKKERVGTITLNRPKAMNAINTELLGDLQEVCNQIALDKEIRVIVLEGSGGNFCSGADMSWLNDPPEVSEWMEILKSFHKTIRTIREFPQPVITKLRGVAVGGGADLYQRFRN